MTLSVLEGISKFFNDMRRRSASLRQLSYLCTLLWA